MNAPKRISIRALPWLLLALAATPRLAATPTFELIGDLPGGSNFSQAYGVSADGTYVVGASSSTGSFHAIAQLRRLEAFVWDATSRTMVGLGDLDGGGTQFASGALDVSADGRFACGYGRVDQTQPGQLAESYAPFRWERGVGMTRLFTAGNLSTLRGDNLQSGAVAISDSGAIVTGYATWHDIANGVGAERGFYWSPTAGLRFFDAPVSSGGAIRPDGGAIVGSFSLAARPPTNVFRVPLANGIASGPLEDLGQLNGVVTHPTGVSADGRTIVGTFSPGGPIGAFLFTEGAEPPYSQLRADGAEFTNISTQISGDGRVVLDWAGGLYLDGQGPFDLREMLAEAGVIDLRALTTPFQFRASALSTSGMFVVGYALVGGSTQAWRVRLSDCDRSGIADELEQRVVGGGSQAFAQGSGDFYANREVFAEEDSPYGTMIARYGKPWKPGADRIPSQEDSEPAEFLRAVLSITTCSEGFLLDEAAAERFLTNIAFPALKEIHSFEMLLGNEAFSDALDPTWIDLEGNPPDDLTDEFAFKGADGIEDLLDEELALARGRELPGSPADWVDDSEYYPDFSGRRAAVYNRLEPNANGTDGLAYRSNYLVADNFEAAAKFPQGHGDAYGYHLTALKAGIGFLRDGPGDWPEQFRGRIAAAASSDSGLEVVRDIAEAGAARAQSAHLVTELLYRRDYREDPEDPRAVRLFVDSDPERAWSMGEWARRGAAGAYLDWALVAHRAPTDEARPVRRDSLGELDELAGAVSGLQERLDTAGSGLDPLGLLPNVVPFGIDAEGLDASCREGSACSGSSHYQQVSAAAQRAIDNARKAFEAANQAGQRLRDSDRSFDDFAERIEDTTADFDQQLIEVFGLPSPSDLADNDLDGESGEDLEESESFPDLTNFFATDDLLAANGMGPRAAPGQVQLGISELRVASLGVEKAELELDNNAEQIQSQIERIQLVSEVQMERVDVISEACEQQESLTRQLEKIQTRKKLTGLAGGLTAGLAAAALGRPDALIGVAGQAITLGLDSALEDAGADNEFDIEIERQRVQCNKELKLQGLEDLLQIDAERRQLKELLRQTPLLIVARHEALQGVMQAHGRLKQAVARGRRLFKEKQRLLARTEGNLLEERWRDMSFRVFRNAALKNYRAFFDIAARYVVLAARAYAYEFNRPAASNAVLAGIYRQRRLGSAAGGRGLQGVLARLDGDVEVNNFNRPLESLGQREFDFKQNLLGAGFDATSDLRFRAFLESQIVERVQDLPEVRELAQLFPQTHFGPGIVIPFGTEIDGRNFFGRGPEPPYGNSNFLVTRNAKIRSYAISLEGVDASALGIDANNGSVSVYLLPVGESVLRENTNAPEIEELPTPWAVVDQYLPLPPSAPKEDVAQRSFNPWSSTAVDADGNYLNQVKRHLESEAQVDVGFPDTERRFNTNLAGRSAWNTRWLLIIPGKQWSGSSNPAVVRQKLLVFIYGSTADPAANRGIFNIRFIIQGYTH
jgi:uncharacterized membrane protein